MWPRPILRTENNIKAIIHSCQLLGGRGWGTFQRCSFQLQKQKPYKAAKLYLAQAFRQLAAASPISRRFQGHQSRKLLSLFWNSGEKQHQLACRATRDLRNLPEQGHLWHFRFHLSIQYVYLGLHLSFTMILIMHFQCPLRNIGPLLTYQEKCRTFWSRLSIIIVPQVKPCVFLLAATHTFTVLYWQNKRALGLYVTNKSSGSRSFIIKHGQSNKCLLEWPFICYFLGKINLHLLQDLGLFNLGNLLFLHLHCYSFICPKVAKLLVFRRKDLCEEKHDVECVYWNLSENWRFGLGPKYPPLISDFVRNTHKSTSRNTFKSTSRNTPHPPILDKTSGGNKGILGKIFVCCSGFGEAGRVFDFL